MSIKRNYKKKLTFNPFLGDFDYITTPRSPVVDVVDSSEPIPISALSVVYYTGEGEAGLADASDLAKSYVAGVTNNAANTGDSMTVVTKGPMSDSNWSWTPGLPLFVTATGTLTQTPPVAPDNRIQIGHARSATEMEIQIKEPLGIV